MAFESYRICDECGKRVKQGKKKNTRSWINVGIESYNWVKPSKKKKLPFSTLDATLCSISCARKAVKRWLDEQE